MTHPGNSTEHIVLSADRKKQMDDNAVSYKMNQLFKCQMLILCYFNIYCDYVKRTITVYCVAESTKVIYSFHYISQVHDDEDEAAVNYENVGIPSASVRLHC